MTRTLILIANVGTDDNPAAGAKKDIEDYKRFFTSDMGGAWDPDSEIVEYDNTPSSDILLTWDILDMCIRCHSDSEYFVIVFCGHGEAKQDGSTYLELSPGNECRLSDITDLLGNTKHTIIADSCRSVELLQEGGTIPRRVCFSASDKDSKYRELCKKYYNMAIRNASAMGVICYSSSFMESAIDLGRRKGGLFSQALITKCHQYEQWLDQEVVRQGLEFGRLTLSDCLPEVQTAVSQKSGNRQHPVLETKNGVDDFPFIICPNWQLQL